MAVAPTTNTGGTSNTNNGFDWGALFNNVISAGAGIYAADRNKDAAQAYGDATQYNPYDVFTPFGAANFDRQNGQTFLTPNSPLSDPLTQFGLNNLTRADVSDPRDLLPADLMWQSFMADQNLSGIGTDAMDASKNAFSAFNNFNPDTYAADQKTKLDDLARPGEENLVNRTVQRLFGSGQLGIAGADNDVMGRITQALERGETERGVMATDLAGREQTRLGNLGSSLRQTGLDSALARYKQASSVYGQGDDMRTAEMNRFTQSFNALQALQQQLLQLGTLGGQLGGAQSTANFGAFQPLLETRKQNNQDVAEFFRQFAS